MSLRLLEKWREPYFNGYVASQWHYFTEAVGGIMHNTFKRYGVTPKTASRAIYFTRLVKYIGTHDFKIDDAVLRAPQVWELARQVREEKIQMICGAVNYMDDYHYIVEHIEVPHLEFDSNKLFIEPVKEFVRRNM